MLQIPEFGIGHRNGEGNGFSGGFEGYRADMFSLKKHFGINFFAGLGVFRKGHNGVQLLVVHIGGQLHFGDVVVRHILHPDRLPDTGATGIVAGFVVVVEVDLFSGILEGVSSVVIAPDHDPVFAGGHRLGNIQRKGRISASVAAHRYFVDPYFGRTLAFAGFSLWITDTDHDIFYIA